MGRPGPAKRGGANRFQLGHRECSLTRAVVDFEILLARDHADLERALDRLGSSALSAADRREALEAARLGFATHAEAEANVLLRAMVHVPPTHASARRVMRVLDEHCDQEALLLRLSRMRPGCLEWVRTLRVLRSCLAVHIEHERVAVLPAVRELAAPSYERLATSYATERLRALGMMSAVVPTPRRARAETQT